MLSFSQKPAVSFYFEPNWEFVNFLFRFHSVPSQLDFPFCQGFISPFSSFDFDAGFLDLFPFLSFLFFFCFLLKRNDVGLGFRVSHVVSRLKVNFVLLTLDLCTPPKLSQIMKSPKFGVAEILFGSLFLLFLKYFPKYF